MSPIELLPWDAADDLTTEKARILYLNYILEESTLEEDGRFDISMALGAIARAKDLTEAAEAAGLDHFSLYRQGEPPATPLSLEEVIRIMQALGYRLMAGKIPPQKAD